MAHHAGTAPGRRPQEDQDSDEIVWQAVKIGYDNLDTELRGGISAWAAAGFELTSTPLLPAESLDQRALLDVRQSSEYLAGHVAGAAHVGLGDLGTQTDDLPAGPLTVMCGHGERAMTAASVLERAGRTDLVAVAGGPEDVSTHRGGPLEAGR